MGEASGPGSVVEASLDVVVDGAVMGWARDPSRADGVAVLQLRLGARRLALFRADGFRPDLRDAGLGTGHHGFEVPVPRDAWDRARRTGDRITCSPIGEPDRILFSIDNDERLDAPGWLRPLLVAALSADDEPPPAGGRTPAALPSYAPLFAPATAVAASFAPGLFPYAEHVRQWKGVGDRFAPELIGPDLDHFMRWYVEDYAAACAPLRAPLSAAVVRWLNEPMVIGGRRHAPTRAMLWSMADGGRGFAGLDDDEAHLDLLYWWACERAPGLAVEDCLVSRSQRDALRHVPEHWDGQAFPLSRFMERALVRRPALSRLGGMQSLSARVTAYALLAVEAVEEPGLLRFVPRSVLDRLFGGDAPLFDALAAGVLAGEAGANPLTSELYRARLGGRGFDLDRLAFLSLDADGNRCEAARLGSPAVAAPVDVQVVGPFGKASGVARAARLSRAVLAATGLSVAAFDCDVDNRQPDDGAGTAASHAAVPARVNLIHLNADMLPLAYAYLPDLHRGAYTIGFFFWELDRPAECHRLALDLVDEVWVASDYNRRCFAAWTEKPVVNVGAAVDVGPVPSREAAIGARRRLCRAGPDDFVVLATFDALSFVSRKNPLGLVRAFRDAFPDDPAARLVIKTHNSAAAGEGFARRLWEEVLRLADADDRIVVLDETLSFASLMALTAGADCYASLHRSEGLGFGMLEAMRLGVPVVCTAYSGNLDFCDDETAWLVEADEVPVAAGDYAYAAPGHRWAEPRHAAAVAALRELRSDEPRRRSRAEAARARATERHGIDAAAGRYAARLGEILDARPAPDRDAPADPASDKPRGAEGRRPRLFAWPRGTA